MASRDYTVDRMRPGEQPAVIAMLARAFYDDPLFGYFLPDLVRQSRGLLAFMGSGVADARPFNEIWVARTGDQDEKVACAAVWLPPDGYPRTPRRDLMTIVRGFPSFARAGSRIAASLQLLAAVDRAHHDVGEPHYYLAILGTDPLYQRTGAGKVALQPILDRADTEGRPAYLETQKEENLAYYARHGFELVDKIESGKAPPVWTMLRRPR